MSAGIKRFDRGIVSGVTTTWHGISSYVCQPDKPVSIDQAKEVLHYPVEKCQLHLADGTPVDGAHALKRNDHNIILYPNVGDRYVVIENDALLEFVENGIMKEHPELAIESVGTLYNGQTAFVNIMISKFAVKGDNSETVNRLMYSNSFGGNSYMACCHSTRIVCDNTRRMAEAQGATNATLKKFRHTANAGQKINDHLVDISEIYVAIEKDKAIMDSLVDMQVDDEYVKAFLNKMIPLPELKENEESNRAHTIATNNRNKVIEIFDEGEDLQGKVKHSRYALLNAVTDFVDHHTTVRNGDDNAKRFWNGLYSNNRDGLKQKAFNLLQKANV